MEEMSPEEEGMLPPQGGPGQADGAGRRVCLLCPFRDHSSSTSIKGLFLTFFFGGGRQCVMETLKKAVENLSLEK